MPDNTMIGRYLAARERAVTAGDGSLVAEIDFQLRRLGYRSDIPATAGRAEAAADAEAVPRGRARTQRSDSE